MQVSDSIPASADLVAISRTWLSTLVAWPAASVCLRAQTSCVVSVLLSIYAHVRSLCLRSTRLFDIRAL